jgi:hypothetical protein
VDIAHFHHGLRINSGNLAIFTAIRRASFAQSQRYSNEEA